MEAIINISNKRLRNINTFFTRYRLSEIDWSDRLISIAGSRGAGKTTMMLQHLRNSYGLGTTAVYMSLDNTFFTKNSLVDTVVDFANSGGEGVVFG